MQQARATERLVSWAELLLGCALLCVLAVATPVRAQGLDLSKVPSGQQLDEWVSYYITEDSSLDVKQVARLPETAFRKGRAREVNFGYAQGVHWVRLEVNNPSRAPREWLLELAFPLLDDVILYEARPSGGFDEHRTGDMRPFASRDVAYRNFVFALTEPAHSQRTLYLRVASTGSIMLPLVAWTERSFIEQKQLEWAALCAFYGVLLIMACFNTGLYLFTKQPAYLPYLSFILSIGFVQFSLVGHTHQFVFPDQPWLTHLLLPVSMGVVLTSSELFFAHFFKDGPRATSVRWLTAYCALVTLLCLFLPFAVAVRLQVANVALLTSLSLLRTVLDAVRRRRRARAFLLGWLGPTVAGLVIALRSTGLLPSNMLTEFSLQIGLTLQLVLLSSLLADNFRQMEREVAQAHQALSTQVEALSNALVRAEEATREAEQATRAKDDFMATMSHEFRTPLNPIINIPEGLLEQFESVCYATCNACSSHFQLEPGERVEESACPECQASAGFQQQTRSHFVGDATTARKLLFTVEQSGQKLLRVVNGILDFSKLESGHLKLVRERVHVELLLENVVAELVEVARGRGVRVVREPCAGSLHLFADPQRLFQVLVNLVDNAIKFSPQGATVRLAAQRTRDSLLFSVRDEGMGIAAGDQLRIFESFEQVHKGNTRAYGGTGLGLSVARSLTRMHGGELWVESEPGRGALFLVRIPTSVESALPQDERPSLRGVGA